MKNVLIIFVCLNISFVHCQRPLELEKITKLEISSVINDSLSIYSFKSISNIEIVIHTRLNETFEPSYILYPDYIESSTEKMVLDDLYGLDQIDYTGSYDPMDCYYVRTSTYSFCILSFVDVFTIGTNQQVFFVVLKQTDDNWEFYASYKNEHGMPTDNIRVITKNDNLKLKGKFLRLIKSSL